MYILIKSSLIFQFTTVLSVLFSLRLLNIGQRRRNIEPMSIEETRTS